ncbi:general stress 14 domain protein, partial [Vibrio parahaemolyticus V-223/04]
CLVRVPQPKKIVYRAILNVIKSS